MTHLKHHLLESSDEESPQEEFYQDHTLRVPDWVLEKNINQDDLQKYEVSDDYIRGQFEPLNTPVETA